MRRLRKTIDGFDYRKMRNVYTKKSYKQNELGEKLYSYHRYKEIKQYFSESKSKTFEQIVLRYNVIYIELGKVISLIIYFFGKTVETGFFISSCWGVYLKLLYGG